LGGVSVVLALSKAYPDLAMVYLADQIHAPYGNKSKQEICEIMESNIAGFNVKAYPKCFWHAIPLHPMRWNICTNDFHP
jgi:glutamate racemase